MNIAQLSEQLKDVPQNRLIDYARNPNSVVPQFLALAEIQRRQHLQAQAQPVPATVAEDVLGQAAPQVSPQVVQMAQQLPENQPGVAQLPTGMPRGMAGGGIVAFADGGDIYDDEEEGAYDSEEMQVQKDENRIRSLIAAMRSRAGEATAVIPRVVQAIKEKLPASYESAKSKTDATTGIAGLKGTHPYEPVAIDEAKKLGLDLNLVRHVLHKETGGLKDPATARSKAGAYGPMQLMPGTAKELGVDIADPEQNTRGGVRYLAQMMNKFKDPTLALAAYNAGPGRVQQMLRRGQGIESLSPETQGYVRFAKGGIASYAGPTGSVVSSDDEDTYNPYAMMGDIGASHPSYKGSMDMGVGQFLKRKLMGIQETPVARAAKAPSPEDWQKFDQAQALWEAEQRMNAPNVTPTRNIDYDIGFGPNKYTPDSSSEQDKSVAPSWEKEMLARNLADRQALKEQAQTDAYLALMQAGLGMMAGSSPYALQNIGAGGMQGVSAYAAAKKQRAAEAAALGKEELSVRRLKQLEESEKAALEQAGYKTQATLGQRESEARDRAEDRAFVRIQKLDTDIERSIRRAAENDFTLQASPNKEQIIERRINEAKAQNPLYARYYKEAGLGEFKVPEVSAAIPAAAIEALKKNPKMKEQFDLKYGTGSADRYLGK